MVVVFGGGFISDDPLSYFHVLFWVLRGQEMGQGFRFSVLCFLLGPPLVLALGACLYPYGPERRDIPEPPVSDEHVWPPPPKVPDA